MKNLLTTTIAFFFGLNLFAQSQAIEFTYDAAGNRIERHIIELKKDDPGNKPTNKSSELETFTDTMGESEISIFPNPVKGQLTVKITNLEPSGVASMEVFSLSGKSMFSNKKLKESTRVDLSKLPKGTYILKIMLGKEVSTWKVVKE